MKKLKLKSKFCSGTARVARTMTLSFLLAQALPGCGDERSASEAPAERDAGPPQARWELVARAAQERSEIYHASDGSGRAWVEAVTGEGVLAELEGHPLTRVRAGSRGRFALVYQAGSAGMAAGGALDFDASRYWGWSPPQPGRPDAPGYTRAEGAEGEPLQVEALSPARVRIRPGRALAPGERIRIIYGAGSAQAQVDRYAEKRSTLWLSVDGDGDGVSRRLLDSPSVEVVAGAAKRLVAVLPSVARPGEPIELRLALVDAHRNAVAAPGGEIALESTSSSLLVPTQVVLPKAPDGPGGLASLSLRLTALGPGTVRIRARYGDLVTTTNPMVISKQAPRIFWGDLHGHSAFSDGTGEPDDYYRYARDVAGLDIAALTDHDHWGPVPLYQHPDLWKQIGQSAARFHEPGRFVTLLGYEWTSWIHGHRHVLFFEREGPLLPWSDPLYRTPQQLWEGLRGRSVLTFAHHSAGGPIPTNWDFAPDPELEPVTEIVSGLGSSEAEDAPRRVLRRRPGLFVRDVLDLGHRLGFIGSGDRHDGHPGLAFGSPPRAGMAAILAEGLSRQEILEALRARRVYATNGPRIVLETSLGGAPIGASVPAGDEARRLLLRVVAERPLASAELVRSGQVVTRFDLEGALAVERELGLLGLEAGEYLYWRVLQRDGGAAWSSPFFVGPDSQLR